jgi:hypothetical protein
MIDRLLQIHLEPILRGQRRGWLLRTVALGWLALAGVGLLFILFRLGSGWASPWSFPLLLLAAMGWTIVAWRQTRRSVFDYQAIARKIEEENPRLHALLLTAVEQKPDSTGELNYLQERVIREALAQDRSHKWRTDTSQHLVLAQLGGVAALVLLGGVLASLYQSAPPRAVFFALTGRSVVVTPGDASVEKGSSLVVLARFNGDVPAEATLVVRPANEPERRIPLAKNLDDPVFGTSLTEVVGELTYRVEYGHESTRDFRVVVFEYPRLERADAKVTYPEYTGLPEKTIQDTRRVSAVEGSALDYTFHLNKPVQSATLVAKDASRISLLSDTNRPNVVTTNFKLDKSQRYELVLVDEAGRTNKLPPLFVIDALTNRAPDLKFAFPRGDQRVSALEEIAFKAEVSDDFGLKSYGIAYNLAGQETEFVELGQTASAHEKRAFDRLVPLEDLGAQPDQLLSYYVWADDVGPDGNLRRTASDMYFAEVRPFEEIFREGQAGEGGAQQQQQQQQQQNAAERLAELQKQIINATWNLQRRESGKAPSSNYKKDAEVVKESQENALEQVRTRRENTDDPRSAALIETVEKEMEKAVEQLSAAADENSLKSLPPALASEQSAYQALLRLAAREYQVSRGQNSQGGQGGQGGQRAQRQLDQLDLRQSQNRYETQRQAAPPQNSQQREQLQAFNRLKELAQRQQDMNERLRELQSALQEARTEAEREELRRQLKRLQEDQQQMLADVDELRQRMERPENQSQMAEARQQLEQTRSEVQQASEAMERGDVSEALSSATRAQRDLQELRDDFRRQNSSQFAEDMRELRSEARELAQQQEEIGQKLDALDDHTQRKTLTDSTERQELASQLDEQKKRTDELVKHATEVTQEAEPVEPLLSRQLYETLRKATQDDARDLQETTDDLLSQGRMYRTVYERLRSARDGSRRPVELAAEFLREGFTAEAGNLEERARRSINNLREGVERAADSVLGDDAEALRLARSELEDLSDRLEREIAQARGQTNTNRAGGASASPGEQQAAANRGDQQGEGEGEGRQQAQNESQREGGREGEGQQQAQNQSQRGQGQEGNQPGEEGQQGQGQAGRQPGQGQSGESQQQTASANQGRGGGNNPQTGTERTDQPGQRGGQPGGERQPGDRGGQTGQRNFFDQFGGTDGGGGTWGGPITGTEYTQWSDRLRDVEEMLDVPELRAEAARIRDRARNVRVELKRHSKEPQWDLVQMEIAGPLVELRARISEELARRESKEALVPIDRDPVPTRYSELVRRYYEELGRSESVKPAEAGELK